MGSIATNFPERWYPAISWVRDDGFYAVCIREQMEYQDACRLFGFDIPEGKPSVPKRIKRDVARGKTSLFGELLETRELNQWDHLHTVLLADGKTTFEVATYNPGDRWPEAWTSGAALASPRGGAILTGHPVKIGDLIQITGAMPNGQIKGNCLIWDIEHDLVVWDVKPELRAWQGQIYLSVLNELHGGPANLDVQTASNLDLAKVRDHKLIQYLCQQYACDVFDLMRDDEQVKEEIGFYNPAAWIDENGNPVINENRWKLWRMYSAGLPAMQFRSCRDAFYRTQMESPENNNPDRFRIRFREPQDLMTVAPEELAGMAVRRYLFPEPFVFDKQGYPHWDRSTLPDVESVYLGGFNGEFISLRNPNASHKESGKLRGRRLQRFADIDRGSVMFVHLGFAASPDGIPGMAKSFNGADFDDSVLALLDPEIVQHWKALPAYPSVKATATEVKVIDDGDALFQRHPTVTLYDHDYVTCMLYETKRGQTGIGYVVNAITWFNLLWLHRESIVAELKAMQPSQLVADAIGWMEQELPKCQMPMVCNGVTIKPVTYRNPQSQENEPGAEVFLEGTSEPLGWIAQDHLPLVTSELTGVLVSGGQYALKVLCPLGADNQGVRPSRPLGVKTVLIGEPDPIPEEEYLPARSRKGLCLEVVNGWQSKINSWKARPVDLDSWKAKAGSKAVIRPTTFVRAGVPEPAVAVYLDGHADQFGWIAKGQIGAVKQEMHGYLGRMGQYTLEFICDQPQQGARS